MGRNRAGTYEKRKEKHNIRLTPLPNEKLGDNLFAQVCAHDTITILCRIHRNAVFTVMPFHFNQLKMSLPRGTC